MANNVRCFVPTGSNGVYFTSDLFASPPVWATINTGLTDLNVFIMDVDPGDQLNRQVLYPTSDVWLRDGGAWSNILTDAQFGVEVGDANAIPGYAMFDRNETGRIWVIGARINAAFNAWVYFAYSDDDGASWSSIALDVDTLTPFLAVRNVAGLYANGNEIIFTTGNGSDEFVLRSTDLGVSWSISAAVGTSVYNVWTYVQGSNIYASGNGAGAVDLLRLDKATLGITILQNALNLGLDRPDRLVFITDNHQRLIKNNKLFITNDAWASVVNPAPANLSEDGANAITLSPDDSDKTLVGRTTSIGVPDPETLTLLPNEATVTLSALSGANPDTGVDSILFTSGGAVSFITAFGVAPTGATITPDAGNANRVCENQTYTVTVTGTPTTPITYTWSTDGLVSGQGTATAVYLWEATGSHTVTVIVSNASGIVTDSITIDVVLTLRQIADAIADTLSANVTGTCAPAGKDILNQVMSWDEFSEGMNNTPVIQVRWNTADWDPTGDIDRFTMKGGVKVQDYEFIVDYFATPRNQLSENIALVHCGADAIIDVLLDQDCPAFGLCVLELVKYHGEYTLFTYTTEAYVGIRFTLTVRVF